jgi:hypothetical protein
VVCHKPPQVGRASAAAKIDVSRIFRGERFDDRLRGNFR